MRSLPDILEDIRLFALRYVVFADPAYPIIISLWVAHTWSIICFDTTPYLYINSPAKSCGKTRLLDLLKCLCYNPWSTAVITAAVLYRKIDKDSPTVLLDEIDVIFNGKNADTIDANPWRLRCRQRYAGRLSPGALGRTTTIYQISRRFRQMLRGYRTTGKYRIR